MLKPYTGLLLQKQTHKVYSRGNVPVIRLLRSPAFAEQHAQSLTAEQPGRSL